MRASLRDSKNGIISLISIILVFCVTTPVEAGKGLSDIRESDVVSKTEPVYFAGDRFSYDLKTGVVTGSGDIEVVQDESTLRGDKVIINLSKKVAEIDGDVVATRGADVVEGTRGVYDFENQTGVFYEARGYSDPWYVTAEKIKRASSGEYSVAGASLTTCDRPHPHYGLKAGSITVVPEERVIARNITLFAGPVPLFYIPYYSQGLGPSRPPLEFDAGTQTDLGAYASLRYNLELSREISLYPHIEAFTKSGLGGGVDGRLDLFEGRGRGTFDSFYISDMNDSNTDEAGIDKDRGKLDFYYRQELPYDFTALIQEEYVSDREFLKTFDFDEFSERELPETFFNLERTGEHSVISFITRVRLVDYIDDIERLPQLRLELLEQRIGDTGLFLSAANETAYLNVEPHGAESARNFSQARLAYPKRLWNWLELVPFIEGDATYYSKTPMEDDEYRLSWETGVVSQARFQRVFNSPFPQYTAFRHLFVPTVIYRYRPTPDEQPDELPQFDSIDLIDRENMVEVELRNYLQAKRPDGSKVELGQYTLTAGLEFDDGEDRLAELENEFLLRPVPNWELALKSLNDFRDERRSDLVSAVIGYTKPDSFKASVGVIHEDTVLRPFETQVVYSLSKAFGPLWRAGFEQRYDFATDDFSYQEFWVWRDLHCWEVLVRLRDRREATSVMVLFNIKAFPLRQIERKTEIKPSGENHPWPTRW